MKKLFLILVSVLLLGGCSVDDDTSVVGGGVSSGGDDMAITTYPNVVEASRTVVEGGYLVTYRSNQGLLSLIIKKIFDCLGLSTIDIDVISKKLVDISFLVRGSYKLNGADTDLIFRADIKRMYVNTGGFYVAYSINDLFDKSEKQLKYLNGVFSGDDVTCVNCVFTIFEPSE